MTIGKKRPKWQKRPNSSAMGKTLDTFLPPGEVPLPPWWPTEAELIAATEAELERMTRSTSNKGPANKCQHDQSR